MPKKNKKMKHTPTTIEDLVDRSWELHDRIITAISETPDIWPQLAEVMPRIGAGSGVNLDYSLDSIQVLEDLLLQARPLLTPFRTMCAYIAGCYFGETLIRNLGGSWEYRAEDWPYAQSGNGFFSANVIGKCSRLLRTGERDEEGLVALADVFKDFSRYSTEEMQAFMDKIHADETIHTDGYTVKSSGDAHAG